TAGTSFGGFPGGGAPQGGAPHGGASGNGGNGRGGNGMGGSTATAGTTGTGGTSGGASGGSGPVTDPDCNTALPTGGTVQGKNGSGGAANMSWELWSNTGKGQMTTFSTPAFVATWNDAGDYLGRLGFEWGGFQSTPVSHDKRGTISAQFVSKRNGTGGQYSYIGMYGWTTNPCVEWYVIDDSYNGMPVNPGNTTKKSNDSMPEMIDGGEYIMYTRNTSGTGGSRCSNVSNWIQYYSVRKKARTCGVISLSQHFKAWQRLGMDMTGELLEAKILVEVGGGNGSVEFPVANVVVQ
ncbi:MAG TPA: glycoside hydrolase family 11 protein, partial [Polyangiaceae bacterium]|nr:glycoside hydrolase family 11 protein [Polyangiaceae bacterium]